MLAQLQNSCLLCTAVRMAQTPQRLQELIPRYLPVRHLRSSTRSRLRIPRVDQTLRSHSIFQCCTQIVEQFARYSETA